MTKSKTKLVTFTKASEHDEKLTVTARRLNDAGFSVVDPDNLFKGETFEVTLKDKSGNKVKSKFTVNRSKLNGAKTTTLHGDSNTKLVGRSVYVGAAKDLEVVSVKRA